MAMSDSRKVREFDGRCTIFLASGIVISDLTEDAADAVMASFERADAIVQAGKPPPMSRARREGRVSGRDPRSERASRPERQRQSR